MELKDLMNSPGLWIASSFTVIAIVTQAIIFLMTSLKEAQSIGMEKERYVAGMRSSIITAIGPSFSPVIVLLSLIAVVGGPTTWMRLCDVGAAQTELSIIALSSDLVGASIGDASFGIEAFAYSIWGMALNDVGWLIVVILCTHRMSGIVDKLYVKYNPAWVKLFLGGTVIGLFSYLLTGQIVAPVMEGGYDKLVAAILAGGSMLIITKALKKHQRLQELSLGIAMLVGMFVTQAIFGN